MEKKIARRMMKLLIWICVISLPLYILAFYAYEQKMGYGRMDWETLVEYAVFPTLLLFVIGFLIADWQARKAEQEALKPYRDFLDYLQDFLAGDKLQEEYPLMEEDFIRELEGHVNMSEFREALREIGESAKVRREFSANVTHELKTPLTSIKGYAEMIEAGMTNEENTKKFAGIIRQQGDRLLDMINEIIELSRFDSGAAEGEETFVPVNLKKLIEEQVRMLKPYAHERNVEISVDLEDITTAGNEKQLNDLFRNLLSNAIKYSKPEGGHVEVGLHNETGFALLQVKDEGIGLDPKDRERIFERFYVANKGRTEKTGTGLGLSLVKHIALRHGGTVEVQSKPGHGSLFQVRIPIKQVDEKEPK